MLSFYVFFADGGKTGVENISSVAYSGDLAVPADSLTLAADYDGRLGKAVKIEAYDDGGLWFKGVVDEVVNTFDSKGSGTKISARSMAGPLLDNEAEPLDYNNPAADFIYKRHLLPHGITEYSADKGLFYGRLRIDKGMSDWQVLQSFCRSRYKTEPRIDSSGKAYLSGCGSDDEVVFDNSGRGFGYVSAKETNSGCKLITEVRVKLRKGLGYDSVQINSDPGCAGHRRVRYVNASADNNSLDTARKIIENGNSRSYSIELCCAGRHIDLLGRNARVKDLSVACADKLEVRRVKYSCDKNGEYTTVVLGRRKT